MQMEENVMDAVNFIKERDRMCRFYHHAGDCYQCPAKDCECSALEGMVDDDNIVTIVEEWAAVHPRKTRQTELLKMFPEAHVSANGSLCLCPASVSAAYRDENGICKVRRLKCTDCCKEFWGQEVE